MRLVTIANLLGEPSWLPNIKALPDTLLKLQEKCFPLISVSLAALLELPAPRRAAVLRQTFYHLQQQRRQEEGRQGLSDSLFTRDMGVQKPGSCGVFFFPIFLG